MIITPRRLKIQCFGGLLPQWLRTAFHSCVYFCFLLVFWGGGGLFWVLLYKAMHYHCITFFSFCFPVCTYHHFFFLPCLCLLGLVGRSGFGWRYLRGWMEGRGAMGKEVRWSTFQVGVRSFPFFFCSMFLFRQPWSSCHYEGGKGGNGKWKMAEDLMR
ncbi:hypothetical protein QBC40DRAFT_285264 [Triangularia verruculosa]|uniref:Uncharacterized protein n=1 Tax=Triangularia verruculosa TaxID=2587418 RepID=A0AAN7AU58_9PEZI|nr:hypothetical protein QBC40DRAFT_285264 [Triangularia verruculosa]